ncbi:MAG: hypothetical protein Q9207_003240 [Kuettlingeria erythrocarpa]
MPLCTITLLALKASIPEFLKGLKHSPIKPLVTARAIRWIIKPTTLSKESLLDQPWPWDLLTIHEGAEPTWSDDMSLMIQHIWSIEAGIPSSITSSFPFTNARLLHPDPSEVPALTGPLSFPPKACSAQSLELDNELREWISSGAGPKGAVSMLNLLAFKPGKQSQYLKYGNAFAESVGSRRGGLAKLVGKIIPGSCSDVWDEMALAHYPSLEHFADMLASEDYQAANHEWRFPSLRDTCILCTSELDLQLSGDSEKAKL